MLLVTPTVIAQELKGPISPSDKVMVLPPSGASTVPKQSDVALAGEAIDTPVGRVSVNATLLAPFEVLLVRVNCRVLTLPGPMVAGANDLSNDSAVWADTSVGMATADHAKANNIRIRGSPPQWSFVVVAVAVFIVITRTLIMVKDRIFNRGWPIFPPIETSC